MGRADVFSGWWSILIACNTLFYFYIIAAVYFVSTLGVSFKVLHQENLDEIL